MIAENLEVNEAELATLLENPDKKKVVLKIIIQALYGLGLEKSAAELQKESDITYLSPEVKSIRQLLVAEDYTKVTAIIKQTNIQNNEVSQLLHELQYFKLIRQEKIQEALQLLQRGQFSSRKRTQLSEELMFGDGRVPQMDLTKYHHSLLRKYQVIIEKCLKKDIEEKSLEKILKSYINLEKRGLTKFLPGLSILEDERLEDTFPPKTIVHKRQIKGEVLFIRFNRKEDKFVTVSELKKKKMFYICCIQHQEIKLMEDKELTIEEDIENISWNYMESDEMIAVATYSRIVILSSNLQVICEKAVQKQHKTERVLCCEWNPINKFLYVGGSFEYIKIYNTQLQQIMRIQPFMNTRSISFNEEGIMIAISASSGLAMTFNIFTLKQQSKIEVPAPIMSMRHLHKNLILTTHKYIYHMMIERKHKYHRIIEKNKFPSPYNSGSIIIEAAFFSQWVITLGQEHFKAFMVDGNKEKQLKWNNEKGFAFDAFGDGMVSGGKELMLWAKKEMKESESEVMESQSEEEQIVEESQMVSEQEESSEENEEEDLDDD